jgi:hypothetical protein
VARLRIKLIIKRYAGRLRVATSTLCYAGLQGASTVRSRHGGRAEERVGRIAPNRNKFR